jgi:homoserine dehydrogenase
MMNGENMETFSKPIKVALLGAGQVGSAIIEKINNHEGLSESGEPKYTVPIIVVSSVGEKTWENSVVTDVIKDAIENDSVNLVIESLPANHIKESYNAAKLTIESKKHLISCNREMWLKHREELAALAQENGVKLILSCLVAAGEGHDAFSESVNETNISTISEEEISMFRGADAEVVAEQIMKDLSELYELVN